MPSDYFNWSDVRVSNVQYSLKVHHAYNFDNSCSFSSGMGGHGVVSVLSDDAYNSLRFLNTTISVRTQ